MRFRARDDNDPVERARQLARQGEWTLLWQLVLSLPLPQAAAAAHQMNRRKWRPPSTADAERIALLDSVDVKEAASVATQLLDRTTHTWPHTDSAMRPVGFAVREPVVALDQPGPDERQSRIVTVDRNGQRQLVYDGAARGHSSLCAVDGETVIGCRRLSGGDALGSAEIVRYTPQEAWVFADGSAFIDSTVRATASGFVVGSGITNVAVAVTGDRVKQLDLQTVGLQHGDQMAVDATGTRIVLADGPRMVITNDQLRPLFETPPGLLSHGEISAVTFDGEDVITSGWSSGLIRWRIVDGQLHPADREARPNDSYTVLNVVSAWGLLIAGKGNINSYYDLRTLSQCGGPSFLRTAPAPGEHGTLQSQAIGAFRSAVSSPLAVFGDILTRSWQPTKDTEATYVQDLEHPLQILNKPISALGFADVQRLSTHLQPPAGAAVPYPLSGGERALLEQVADLCLLEPPPR